MFVSLLVFCLFVKLIALCGATVVHNFQRTSIHGTVLIILLCSKEFVRVWGFGTVAENLHTGPSINIDKLFTV